MSDWQPIKPTRNQRCPPSCPNNELNGLLDRFCSDKGTHFMGRHHYGSAYHSIFAGMRNHVRAMLEVGIGDDTAPSVAAWSHYFPKAHIFALDTKRKRDFERRARPGRGVDKDMKRLWWCDYNRSMWTSERLHLFLETDATKPAQIERLPLPPLFDVIIDDGSHKFPDQEATLIEMWPRLRAGGTYIIEDLLVGALPWERSGAHGERVPSNNTDCGRECYFPQRLAEHPFMLDRFNQLRGAAKPRHSGLQKATRELMHGPDASWFWVVTGVHQGGGLDCALVLRKSGPQLGEEQPAPVAPPQQQLGSTPLHADGAAGHASLAWALLTASMGANALLACFIGVLLMRARRHGSSAPHAYVSVQPHDDDDDGRPPAMRETRDVWHGGWS